MNFVTIASFVRERSPPDGMFEQEANYAKRLVCLKAY